MKDAPNLFNQPEAPHFDGYMYDPSKDHARLTTQLNKVRNVMVDKEWHTLGELVEKCGGTHASISARIRDLRKSRFGGYRVRLKRVTGGLYQYRIED